MPRIRRGGKRIRGSNGGRTRNEDCCCAYNCTQLQDAGLRSTLEASMEIIGLTIGSAGCGANCSNVLLSGVLPYAFDTIPSDGDWAISSLISCNTCQDGFTGANPCQCWLVALLRCSGESVLLRGEIGLQVDDADYYRAQAGGSSRYEWSVRYEDTIPVASFALGSEYTLPYVSDSPNWGDCQPTGMATSTCKLTFDTA